MSRLIAASLAALICSALGLAAPAADAPPTAPARPNILFIVADDFGWNDVGYHGSAILTPTLDKLCREGVELDQHYVQPVCTPTRTALMSGRYPSRFGPHPLVPSNLRALPPGTVTLASALKSLGYQTAMAGKWHLGSRPEWGPNQYGFDHSYGTLTGACDPVTHLYRKGPYANTWHRDGKIFTEEGNATELLAAQVLTWIKDFRAGRAAGKPWFVYVPFTAVHIPVDAPDQYKKLYAGKKFYDDQKKDESFKRYAAYASHMDDKIRLFVEALDQTGQRADTLIIFHSDNGALPSGGNAYISTIPATPVLGSNTPLRGHKAELYEGGIRVPAFANWPGRLKPRKLTAPMHAVDWLPTLAALTGYAPPKPLDWDGQDMWPRISGQDTTAPAPRVIYWPYNRGCAIRHGDWKLIVTGGAARTNARGGPLAQGAANEKRELFNLADDPNETRDLASEQPQKVQELLRLLEETRKKDTRTLPADLKDLPG